MSDYYTCSVCGLEFEYQKDRNIHQENAHNTSITDHTNSKEIKKLEGMTKALRNNDYDTQNNTTDEKVQSDLYGQKVGGKTLNDY